MLSGSEELEKLIEGLGLDVETESMSSELGALLSIYGDQKFRVWHADEAISDPSVRQGQVRVTVDLRLSSPHEDIGFQVLVSLPPTYPEKSPPQLQLLSRYIGAYGVDYSLFGEILRTFISSTGVQWVGGSLCVFDGLESVVEQCTKWYGDRLSMEVAGQLRREMHRHREPSALTDGSRDVERSTSFDHGDVDASRYNALPTGITMIVSEAILDRKSTFIGRACQISSPSQVPKVLAHLMSDRRIARAAHPIINAWRCQVGNSLQQDNDDDGETAAGGRLAHLLQILDANNVLVVVTRYYGGIHLGPDRFKHINQAARNALEEGGFLGNDSHNDHSKLASGKGKR